MDDDGFGQSPLRAEDARLLTGRGRFTGDIDLPRQAYGHVLRSPHAHAEIRAIDTGAARAVPGVLAVLTHAEAAADGIGALPGDDALGLEGRDGREPVTPAQPVLARERVRYVGETVAFVVAESAAAARDAAERIEVDYTPLPAVTDTVAAVAADAPQIWGDAPGNLSVDWEHGDRAATEAAFAAAAHVTRLDLVNNRVAGAPSEPGALVGGYDPGDGRYTLYTPSQGVFSLRKFLARHVLGVPERRLRVVTPDVGGSFGVRIFPRPEHGLVLWAAHRLGRPVKWVADRGEAMAADLHGRDHVTHAELALDADGRFLALRASTVASLGAYVSPRGRTSPTVGYAVGLTGAYAIAHCHLRVRAAFTNTMMTNAYRGAGRPEAIYVIERLVDTAAAELAIAPVELRRRNLVPAAAMPYTTATGEVYDSGDFVRNLDDALARADAEGFAGRREAERERGRRRGIGVATYVKINGGMPHEVADLSFDDAGAVTLAIGTQANGQGHETAYAQLVASRLGLPLDAVRVVQGDTDRVAYGKGTGGSSALSVGGAAAFDAVEKIIAAGRRFAAQLLEAAEGDIDFAGGRYVVAGTDRGVAMAEVARAAFEPGPLTDEVGFGLAERGQYLAKARTYANGCHVCEVEVDVDTGDVEIIRYTVVDDIGRVLNPMLARGQVHGGLAQGIGQALMEACVYDRESGQLLTGSFMDYCLPRAADLPEFAVAFNEIPCTTNPLGVKGVGEAGVTGAPPAVVNAVVDALGEFGVRHIDMPLTPERVWR
ncbi:MAG: xanthine dehydrogenase family protein molybdopterin-binding subunit, partial [Alphaproteobacteria bacterium]